jgi:hypothetical protein
MMKECFGRFGEGECVECVVMELCSSYFVVGENKRCPLFGGGFESTNEICKLCMEYFEGRECKKRAGGRRR